MNGRKTNGDGSRRKPGRKRRGRGRAPQAPTAKTAGDFWGDVDSLPLVETVTLTSDPSAVDWCLQLWDRFLISTDREWWPFGGSFF